MPCNVAIRFNPFGIGGMDSLQCGYAIQSFLDCPKQRENPCLNCLATPKGLLSYSPGLAQGTRPLAPTLGRYKKRAYPEGVESIPNIALIKFEPFAPQQLT